MARFSAFRFLRFAVSVKPSLRFYPIASVYLLKSLAMAPFEILEYLFFSEKIRKHEIDSSPIFILGYWRSGTTYLHRLLALNSEFGYLNFYESFFPTTYLVTESILAPVFQLLLNIFGYQHPAHRIPLRVDFPSEEDIGLALAFDEHSFSRAHVAPSTFESLFEKYVKLDTPENRNAFQGSYREFVKKVSFKNKGKPLVLKTPANLGRISALLEMYPDARFVVIQRNPYEVFASNVGFWKTLRPHAIEPITDEFIEENVLKTYLAMSELFESQVGLIPVENLIQVRYEDLKDDPKGLVSKIYSHFGIPMSDEYRQKLQAFIEENHNEACVNHNLAPNAQSQKVSQYWEKQIEVQGYERI